MVYGSTAEEVNNGTNSIAISSGTEQYHTIDVNKLTKLADGRYLVLIGANGGDGFEFNTLALTNIKVSGYSLSSANDEIIQAVQEENTDSSELLTQVQAYSMLRKSASEDDIAVNENLKIVSAKFKSSKVVSGKNVTLQITATSEADSIVVLDETGNEVEFVKVIKREESLFSALFRKAFGKNEDSNEGRNMTFKLTWKVSGEKGEELNYTVRAKDSAGALSFNEENVTIRVK